MNLVVDKMNTDEESDSSSEEETEMFYSIKLPFLKYLKNG